VGGLNVGAECGLNAGNSRWTEYRGQEVNLMQGAVGGLNAGGSGWMECRGQ
jgi:hypothetical protein